MGKEYRKQVEVLSNVQIASLALLEDNFEPTLLSWTKTGSGTPGLTRDTTVAYNGEASMHGTTRDAGSTNSDFVDAQRWIGLTRKPKINAVFMCRNMDIGSGGANQAITFTVRIGTKNLYFNLNLDDVNHKLYYTDEDANSTEVTGFTLPFYSDIWERIEVQFNIATEEYEFIRIGHALADLSGFKPYVTTNALSYSDMKIELIGIQDQEAEDVGVDINWDNVVITTPD